MSTSNLPQSLPSIEKVLQRIAVAEQTHQKEVRITIAEARALTLELSLFTAKLGVVVTDIAEQLKQIRQNSEQVDVKFEGGQF
jgi:hypothetical protein|tara:strand:+ start:284 stop:532 length:249 start_codon:yes stop_codon:yes gene_type:complete